MKVGDKVVVVTDGNHSLVLGATARVRDVRNDGYAMLTVGGTATAFAPIACLEVVAPTLRKALP